MIGIVEIAGKKGSGKTYLASILTYNLSNDGYRIYKTSFASALKRLIAKAGLTKSAIKIYCSWPEFWQTLQTESIKLVQLAGYEIPKYLNLLKDLLSRNYDKIKEGYELAYYKDLIREGYRIIAQTLGTDVFRELDKDFWVKLVVEDIKKVQDSVDFVIIDDCRFPNEHLGKYFKNLFVIKLETANGNSKDGHPSETEVDKVAYDIKVLRNEEKYYPHLGIVRGFIDSKFQN